MACVAGEIVDTALLQKAAIAVPPVLQLVLEVKLDQVAIEADKLAHIFLSSAHRADIVAALGTLQP